MLAVSPIFTKSIAQDSVFVTLVGQVDLPVASFGVDVKGNYAYVVTKVGPKDTLFIIDVSDPFNPAVVGTLDTQGELSVDVLGDYAYTGGNDFEAVDISNPALPVLTDNVLLTGRVHGLFVSGSVAFLGRSTGHFAAYNVSDPTNILSFDQLVFRSSSEWDVEFNISEGLMSFAFAGTDSIESDGIIANIRYIVSETAVNLDSSPLNFSDLLVNEGSPSVIGQDGSVQIFIIAVENEAENETAPLTMRLHQNYPNPFNPSTTIRYIIYSTGDVVLTIHDMLGREIDRLVDSRQPTGNHTVSWFGEEFTSGVYFYRILLTNDRGRLTTTKKMLLLK